MASTTENVKMGICSVIFDGVNQGLTQGGVQVQVGTSTREVKVDQFGETPVGEIGTGRTVSVTAPLAEATLETILTAFPGAQLVQTGGAKATATVTLATAAPVNGDSVTIAGYTFTFRSSPSAQGDVLIGTGSGVTGAQNSAINLASAINATEMGYVATVAGAVVTVTARTFGTKWNDTVTASFTTPANVTVTNLTGGVNVTSARVIVKTGTGLNLLSLAKKLVLRPKGTFGEDDFVIYAASPSGSLDFTYSTEGERIVSVVFKGYALSDDRLFMVGRE